MSGPAALAVTILDDRWRPRRLLPVRESWSAVLPDLLMHEGRWIALMQRRPSDSFAAPRPADIALTRAIIRSLRPLDLRLADHLIEARDQRFSFRDAGLL
ncbi:MAG: JAB domain-containing protein [Pseudomonadota bacterium]|uniref:JAB domain-containing protein n=1 Tax=Sphingobium naphthae TaxID=1886786 RepID=UPI002B11E7F7|nr:JAB domain-containing protein [Pseudomonadota bacterium]